jgi:hypothetical protein
MQAVAVGQQHAACAGTDCCTAAPLHLMLLVVLNSPAASDTLCSCMLPQAPETAPWPLAVPATDHYRLAE